MFRISHFDRSIRSLLVLAKSAAQLSCNRRLRYHFKVLDELYHLNCRILPGLGGVRNNSGGSDDSQLL
jgi:hypothetical protein